MTVGNIAPATRIILRKQRNAEVLLGDVVGIDLKNKTVTSKLLDWERVTPFDSLIVAAGAQQSYFGNDHFEAFAPGMKTVDDALELRGRILGAFEAAEVTTSEAERTRRLTFVVVGAGPTGVEFGGFLAWLAWLGLHLYYLVGSRNRIVAVYSWFITFLGRGRSQLAITERWVFARRALEQSRDQSAQKSIG